MQPTDVKLNMQLDWVNILNHVYLFLITIGIIAVLILIFRPNTARGKYACRITLAVMLAILEILRLTFIPVFYPSDISSQNSLTVFASGLCAVMTWVTIFTLILSVFIKANNKALQLLYNILFGCAMLGAGCMFVFPDIIAGTGQTFQLSTLHTILNLSILGYIPLHLIKTNQFILCVRNVWAPFGYTYILGKTITVAPPETLEGQENEQTPGMDFVSYFIMLFFGITLLSAMNLQNKKPRAKIKRLEHSSLPVLPCRNQPYVDPNPHLNPYLKNCNLCSLC